MQQYELRAGGSDWELAQWICAEDTVRWAISTFDPFKAPGTGDIFPELLQKGLDLLSSYPGETLSSVPSIWAHTWMLVSGQSGFHAFEAARLEAHQSDILFLQDNGKTGGQLNKRGTNSSTSPTL